MRCFDVGRDDRGRGVGTHATRIRSDIAFVARLVVLRGRERQYRRAVGYDDETRFLAVENSSTTIVAPAVPKRPARQHVGCGLLGFLERVCATVTPLPAARPSALMTIGAPCSRM